ncbi:MAG: class I SAM-dependent methyltransferase, partial [Candidatus Margulisiibacteriota bacterium]
ESFDLVCSFQTLDHLSDPAETVAICRDLLRPNGVAYFVTHNVASLTAKILGEKSPIIDVEHIYLFNKKTLRRLFTEAGFKVLKVGNLYNSYPLNYWLKLLFKERQSGKIILNIINAIGLGRLAFPLPAGNIFIIAQLVHLDR